MKIVKLKSFLLVFLITILVIGSVSTYSVVADDHDETESDEAEDEENYESDDDDDYEDDDREVEIEVSDSQVSIESESSRADVEDEFSVEISSEENAEIEMEYNSENGTTETEAELKVEFFELIEYSDINSDGVYNESVDTEIQTYKMSEVGYEPINYTTQDHTDGTEHIITLETSDGVFKLVVHVVGQMTNISGTNLKPTSLKIDIIINNFDFIESASKLALYSEVKSTSEIEKDDDADDQVDVDEEAFKQSGEGIFAFYSWKKTAEVDGVTTDVLASYEENTQTEQKLYLNYQQGNNIVHDPKLGVSLAESVFNGGNETENIIDLPSDRLWPEISPVTFFAIALVAAILSLAIPAMIYRKKNN